jgi:predicted transcriptional regulator
LYHQRQGASIHICSTKKEKACSASMHMSGRVSKLRRYSGLTLRV